jgi:hypothetical protein
MIRAAPERDELILGIIGREDALVRGGELSELVIGDDLAPQRRGFTVGFGRELETVVVEAPTILRPPDGR